MQSREHSTMAIIRNALQQHSTVNQQRNGSSPRGMVGQFIRLETCIIQVRVRVWCAFQPDEYSLVLKICGIACSCQLSAFYVSVGRTTELD